MGAASPLPHCAGGVTRGRMHSACKQLWHQIVGAVSLRRSLGLRSHADVDVIRTFKGLKGPWSGAPNDVLLARACVEVLSGQRVYVPATWVCHRRASGGATCTAMSAVSAAGHRVRRTVCAAHQQFESACQCRTSGAGVGLRVRPRMRSRSWAARMDLHFLALTCSTACTR